ncbi:uncharacterized protein LOC129717413 isoform X2 [Wyeomyia smithii]|uniref:uncharacterized protein LOC129717413 isoform X2 n=1 Tax=Wyeomyia smithii TaxID=174621 RepID=UPI002467C1D5|nr:uncharacterized protein LOC129717413 isoform X2 [Wyeomyia smithii]
MTAPLLQDHEMCSATEMLQGHEMCSATEMLHFFCWYTGFSTWLKWKVHQGKMPVQCDTTGPAPTGAVCGLRLLVLLFQDLWFRWIAPEDFLIELLHWHRSRWALAGVPGPATSDDCAFLDRNLGWDAAVVDVGPPPTFWHRLGRYIHRGSRWVDDIRAITNIPLDEAIARLHHSMWP